MASPEVTSATMLAITQSISAFHTFLPPLADVRKHDESDRSFAADVRIGEVASVALAVGVGGIVSSLTGSPVPAGVSLLVAVGLVVLYESTLRSPIPFEGKVLS